MNKALMRQSPIPFAMLCLGLIIGAGLMVASMPLPTQKGDCQTYNVARKPVTAYVLRPPPAPVAEPAQCPAVQVTKCEENVSKESVSNGEVSKEEPKTIRHRRHRRYRAYWR